MYVEFEKVIDIPYSPLKILTTAMFMTCLDNQQHRILST